MTDPIVIVGARRTPMGAFQGELSGLTAAQLGASAIRAALAQAGVPGEAVERGVIGCVLGAGQGQAPARQALLGAGLPQSCAAVTVNKMCGSGMQAAIDAHDALTARSADIMVAGGMESMTNAPYLIAKARGGLRMGHGEIKDSMFLDGLEDAYEPGRLMGSFAEDTARDYQFTRAAQDAWAIRSTMRAQAAIAGGAFDAEVVPVAIKGGEARVDEQPGKARLDKIPTLKPAFAKDGTITAANASSISDGAAALILMRASVAAAPSLIDEALAAVTVPSLANAGLSSGILSRRALPGCSSMRDSPPLTATGVTSASNMPPAIAACARVVDRIAHASCASLVN